MIITLTLEICTNESPALAATPQHIPEIQETLRILVCMPLPIFDDSHTYNLFSIKPPVTSSHWLTRSSSIPRQNLILQALKAINRTRA